MPRSFGAALRVHRRAAGISQRELADRAGLDFTYISKIENERVPPPAADTVVELCRILGVPPGELLALTGKIPSGVEQAVSSSEAAQDFLREVERMRLSDAEWKKMMSTLRKLRGNHGEK
jgi:transcriptional regulator with XRE-family HTH domain